VFDEISWRVVLRQFGIAEEIPDPPIVIAEPQAASSSASSDPPVLPRPQKKLTWIEFQIVWDDTGLPAANVRLVVKDPNGEEKFSDTNSQGTIRLDEIDPGSYDLRCDLKGASANDTVHFAGMGKPAAAKASSDGRPRPRTGTFRIAKVEQHKVKKGESIDGLAKGVGMTWKELAKFNWGTDSPDEINKNLAGKVGCTKKTKDGNNYVFDDSDNPGIVLIPSKWEQLGLATGDKHILRVKPVALANRVEFNYRLESGEPIVDPAGFELVHPNGKKEQGTLQGGSFARTGVADGEYRMKFKHIASAQWEKESGHAEEEVGMSVSISGFASETEVKFRVFERYQSRVGDPLFEISAKTSADSASASWKYTQPSGGPAQGEFIFEAEIADKTAESNVLKLEAYPLEDVKGVQQRLKYLGYDVGPVDGIAGSKTRAAVKEFQADHPPLAVDGIAGKFTQGELLDVLGW